LVDTENKNAELNQKVQSLELQLSHVQSEKATLPGNMDNALMIGPFRN
jgi:hypothetical protein